MFDIGWSEMMLVAILALIIIGPKELPRVLRSVAHWTRKARTLAREFQSGVDDMIREAELDDAKKAIDSAKHFDIDKAVEDVIDPTGDVKEEANKIEAEARDMGSVESEERVDEPAPAEAAADGTDKGEGEADTEATVVKHPLRVAPPHSINPPPEEEEPAPAPEGKTSQKSA